MIAEILNSYDRHLTFLRRLVSDLDKFQMVCQPKNVPNRPAWTIGHLVHSWQQIGGEIGIPPRLPADRGERPGTGSTPVWVRHRGDYISHDRGNNNERIR